MIKNFPALVFAFTLSFLGLIIMIYFTFDNHFNDGSYQLNTSLASAYGNFIGGIVGPIFSFAGILLIYQTILEQRKLFQLEQFESKFFKLIELHRENINNIKFRAPNTKDGSIRQGHLALVNMIRQITNLKKELKDFEIPNKSDIIFIFFYFGVGKDVRSDLVKLFNKMNVPEVDAKKLIDKVCEIKTDWSSNYVYYEGHKQTLEPYIKMLEENVYFINTHDFLSNDQKVKYLEFIKSLVTDQELKILNLYVKCITRIYNDDLKISLSPKKMYFKKFIEELDTTNIFEISITN